VVLYKH